MIRMVTKRAFSPCTGRNEHCRFIIPKDDGRVQCDWHLTMNTDGLG